MTQKENSIVLLSVTLCWASSYIFIKNLSDSLSTYAYLTLTSGIASLILLILFCTRLRHFKLSTIGNSLILACLTFFMLLFEKRGIATIDASLAAFLASTSIIFVPLILLIFKVKIAANQIFGIVFVLGGLFFSSGANFASMDIGALYMLISAIFMSVYIIAINKMSKNHDPILLSIAQMVFITLISFVLWFIETPKTFWTVEYSNSMLANIFLLAFFAKAFAYTMLVFANKYTNPINTVVIGSTEPVLTLILSVCLPASFISTESLTSMKIIGAALIVLGSVCSGSNFINILIKKARGAHKVADTNDITL